MSGGNTSFDVYFLARDLGNVESSLYINTNKGIIKFNVMGVGIANQYKLKPIINARIPINSSFTHLIQLHNPNNYSLQVLEIYTSDDDLHLELPDNLLDTESMSTSTDRYIFNSNDHNYANEYNNEQDTTLIKQTKSNNNQIYQTSTISNKSLWVN